MATQTLRIERRLWSIGNRSVDALLEGPPRLELHAASAEGPAGATIAVSIGAGVGPDVEARYGGGFMAAAVLVAVDLATGAVRTGELKPAHGFPASLFTDPAAARGMPEVDEDGENVAAERIAVDLNRFLGVPMDGGRHAVFAWLDRLVSGTLVVTTPAAAPRTTPTPAVVGLKAPLIRLRPGAAEPTATQIPFRAAADGPAAAFALVGKVRRLLHVSSRVSKGGAYLADFELLLSARRPGSGPIWALVFDGAAAGAPTLLASDD